jgi:tellurite resistance protein
VSALRKARFEELYLRTPRSAVRPASPLRGTRVAPGPRGHYVGFGAGRFHYQAKGTDGPPSAFMHSDAESVLGDLNQRARRLNFFRLYVCVAAGLLLVSMSEPAIFVILAIASIVGGVYVYRWNVDRRTSRIFYDVDNGEVLARFALGVAAGDALARAAQLWNIYSSTRVVSQKYHAGATSSVQRAPAHCGTGMAAPTVETNLDVWAVGSGASQLILLPDRILARQGERFFSLDYAWVEAVHHVTRFVEDGSVPHDSQVVDATWRFVNKSGGPDLRFNNNRKLPVVAYGELTLRYGNDLQFVVQASNPLATEGAAAAIRELTRLAREPMAPSSYNAPAVERRVPLPVPPAVPRRAPPPVPVSIPAPRSVRPRSGAPAPMMTIPFVRPQARGRPDDPTALERFLGPADPLNVAGRSIASPLTFVARATKYDTDASTIVTSLPVGHASLALPLPYWPQYSHADPDQRARYLDWMAGGRTDPGIPLGYVFIFFYGLERRVLIERRDEQLARPEVLRLLSIHGESRSFRAYASDFLAFAPLRLLGSLDDLSEAQLNDMLRPLALDSGTALATVTAWYHKHQQALPAEYASIVARNSEDAKRSTIVSHSTAELLHLFAMRYRDAFGEGVVLDAAKRPLNIEYRPASPTLLGSAEKIRAMLPDVLGRSAQFRKIVTIWNACIDDLRKANARKRGAGELDAAAWAALPPELRAQYDHPDQDKWDAAVAAASTLAGFRITTAGALTNLAGLIPTDKITPAQMKKMAARAEEVGYALEPEPRLRAKATDPRSEMLIWRDEAAGLPEARVYGGVHAMLSLAMFVAMADGVFQEEEQIVVNSFLTELFTLDSGMRTRVEAMKQLMIRDPSRLGAVAKKLKGTRAPTELAKIAAVLVAIAAADGTIGDAEEKALRTLYRNLGLPAADLTAAITRTGARMERDQPFEVQGRGQGAAGVPIPPPPDAGAVLKLDQAAIDAIVADTKDVAAILAEVFENAVEEPSAETPAPPLAAPDLPRASDETAKLARGLDVRYHAVLEELLSKDEWSAIDVRKIAERHRLMPVAILDTINAWSDDVAGDFLIEDAGSWKMSRDLLKVSA